MPKRLIPPRIAAKDCSTTLRRNGAGFFLSAVAIACLELRSRQSLAALSNIVLVVVPPRQPSPPCAAPPAPSGAQGGGSEARARASHGSHTAPDPVRSPTRLTRSPHKTAGLVFAQRRVRTRCTGTRPDSPQNCCVSDARLSSSSCFCRIAGIATRHRCVQAASCEREHAMWKSRGHPMAANKFHTH
jgi:hypothetical protein